MNILARPFSAIVLPAFATAVFLAAAPVATGDDQPSAENTPVATTWNFVAAEGWSECTDGTFTGTTNVNGHVWNLADCRVDPAGPADGEIGCISLFSPASHAISPVFLGVVTQVTTIFRPNAKNPAREVTLLASTNGGGNFSVVAKYAVTNKVNYTNSFSCEPPLDGGDFGVIFCASNSGTGTVYFRRLSIEGTSTTPEEPDAHPYSPFGASTAGQPQGALSGVVLYLSAGHGYTADDATNDWTTVNALSCGMVEDFGNLDQLDFFALQAWKAGATIVPMRPLGYQTNEVVIDNVDTDSALPSRVTFGGAWANASQAACHYGKDGGVGYRWTYTCPTGTTAWASYRPDIPATGEYPVYVWASPGSDRIPQLYRVHHGGGITDVRVDHRQVGNGWVWIGNYRFEAGTDGCVNISNYSPDGIEGSSVIVADAVRFGNGMGDIERGAAGISGYPRELEGSRYWIQRMVDDSQGLDASIYDTAGTDRDDNTIAPNRMACAMDTGAASRRQHLFLSFHSRDGLSRHGCTGLHAPACLDGSTDLARCIADSIVSNMTLAHAHGLVADAWKQECPPVGETPDGEIGGDIAQKMDAAIVEVAAHDLESDAAILKSLCGREWLAQSALRGVIRHMATQYASESGTGVFPPDAPIALSAINSGTNSITLAWNMPDETNRLSDPHTGFVVYVSTNGYAFGNPVAISDSSPEHSHKFTDLPAGTPYYFRVCATNLGGESLSSPVAGAGLSDDGSTADVLVVDGFKRNDGALSPTVYCTNLMTTASAGDVTLVRPRMINSFDYVKEHGNAIAAAGRSFDFMDAARVTSTDLARYPKVVWCLGEESTADETFSYDEQRLIATYLANHGALLVSGAEIGWDLWNKGSASDKAFMTNWLHCTYVNDNGGSGIVSGKSGTFLAGTSGDFNHDGLLPDIYSAEHPDTLAPVGEAFVAATYGTSGTNGAIIACSNSICLTVVMGYPFETITDATRRNTLMKEILEWFDDAKVFPSWIGERAYTTGLGGKIYIDLKSQVTGFPSPAVTLVGTTDSRTGGEVDEHAYLVAEDGFIFEASPDDGIGIGTYTFTFRAENAAGTIDQDIVVTVGNAPVWQAIPDILVDLDTNTVVTLYQYLSGDPTPSLALDPAHTVATEATYAFDATEGFLHIGDTSTPATNIFTFIASNQYDTATVTFTNVIRRLDTDDDGIPDWWAIKYFGGATACNPNLDPDGDGFTNYQECFLGTDPNDPDSYFHLEAETDGDTEETFLVWPTATGMTYTLWSSTNLLLGSEGAGVIQSNLTTNCWWLLPSNPATFFWITTDPLP